MSVQYHTWDRFKDLSLLNEQQLENFSRVLCQLFVSKSLTLTIFKVRSEELCVKYLCVYLKNFNFIELTPTARTFLVNLFVQLFNELDETSLKNLFQLSSTMKNSKFLREALRLFLSHFIEKKSSYSPLIHHRCQIVIHQLSIE